MTVQDSAGKSRTVQENVGQRRNAEQGKYAVQKRLFDMNILFKSTLPIHRPAVYVIR